MLDALTLTLWLTASQHADCFYRKPNGVIVLHVCKKPAKRPRKIAPAPQQRKILVVPTGRELEI